jgi:hypothetical protein
MEKDSELKQLLEEIPMLEKLQYKDNAILEYNKILEWENKVLEILEREMGIDSDCYKDFSDLTKQGFWRPNADRDDRRAIIATDEIYQQDYTNHLRSYKEILQRC